MRVRKSIFAATLAFAAVGCASIIKGTTQTVTISSNVDGAEILMDGQRIGTTPYAGPAPRNKSAIVVQKAGYQSATVALSKTLEPVFWGNIISGGTLGSITDFATGAAYAYAPAAYQVDLKANTQSSGDFQEEVAIRGFAMIHIDEIASDVSAGTGEHLAALLRLLNDEPGARHTVADVRRALEESRGNAIAFGRAPDGRAPLSVRRAVAAVCLALVAWHTARAQDADGPPPAGPIMLAYAGPYASSPSSAFGHLFLIIADRPDTPAPLRHVITFGAVTFDADPLRYLTVGITGGFLGRFTREPFHRRTREYSLLEDRDLWLVELDLDQSARARLASAVAASAGRWRPYSFFSRNCAWYLQELLSEATGALPAPHGIMSPTGVFDAVIRSRIGGAVRFHPGISSRIARQATLASRATRRRLDSDDWRAIARDTAWLDTRTPEDRRLVHLVLRQRTAVSRTGLAPDVAEGVERVRAQLVTGGIVRDDTADDTITHRGFHGYGRLRMAGRRLESGRDDIVLDIRPAMHEEDDPGYGHRTASTLSLLSGRLAVPTTPGERVRIEAFTLFAQRALVPRTLGASRRSWLLESRLRYGGALDPRATHLEVRGGLGRTLGVTGRIELWGLGTIAGVGTRRDGAALVPGVEFGTRIALGERVRTGLQLTAEGRSTAELRRAARPRIWVRTDVGRRVGMHLAAGREPFGRFLTAGIDLSP